MKFIAPFFAAVLAGLPAVAQGVPPTATPLASDGLGAGGAAFLWNWVKSKNDQQAPGVAHIFLQTGPGAEPYGRVTVPLDPIMYPLTSAGFPRPLCTASMAWTGPEYVPPGYANPEPIGITAGQGAYTAPLGDMVDVWWSTLAPLPPYTAYSIIVICASKAGKVGT